MAALPARCLQDLAAARALSRISTDRAPLLTPPQQFFLRENLKLRLLSRASISCFAIKPIFAPTSPRRTCG